VEWCTFLDLEVTGFHREDAYWAQIAAEIRRANVKEPQKVKVEDFLIKYQLASSGEDEQEARKAKALEARGHWLAAVFGAKPKKAPVPSKERVGRVDPVGAPKKREDMRRGRR
jgi:hypothetical protein